MNIEKVIYDVIDYARANPAGTTASLVIIFYLLLRRTKVFFILLSAALAGLGMLLVFEKLSGIGLGK